MRSQPSSGKEIRFFGHSLGTQLAITVAREVKRRADREPRLSAIAPVRVSLTDVTSSKCAHDWLPSPSPRSRGLTPIECLGQPRDGDWVSERLLDDVRDLKGAYADTVFDAYRCWALSSAGIAADSEPNLLPEMAFSELKPNTTSLDVNQKHAFCAWNYLTSKVVAPPNVLASIAEQRCDSFVRSGGVSAAASTATVRNAMTAGVRFDQTSATREISTAQQTVRCAAR
jgi:hypothetical protein